MDPGACPIRRIARQLTASWPILPEGSHETSWQGFYLSIYTYTYLYKYIYIYIYVCIIYVCNICNYIHVLYVYVYVYVSPSRSRSHTLSLSLPRSRYRALSLSLFLSFCRTQIKAGSGSTPRATYGDADLKDNPKPPNPASSRASKDSAWRSPRCPKRFRV